MNDPESNSFSFRVNDQVNNRVRLVLCRVLMGQLTRSLELQAKVPTVQSRVWEETWQEVQDLMRRRITIPVLVAMKDT